MALVHRVAKSWTWLKWLSNLPCSPGLNLQPLDSIQGIRAFRSWWGLTEWGGTQWVEGRRGIWAAKLSLCILNCGLEASGKESACQFRRHERCRFDPWIGNGNLLQYFCLENSMDRRAWRATVHGVAKSQTWLSACLRVRTYTHTHTHNCGLEAIE